MLYTTCAILGLRMRKIACDVCRFLWRDSGDEEHPAITTVNMGDKPAGCIAQFAMRETSNLPQFMHLEADRQVIQ